MFPSLRDARIEHAWGGPIDVSPVHLLWFGTLKSVHYGFGFTGNGVGPTELGGRVLADLARRVVSPLTALPIVGGLPPKAFPREPLRFAGGSAIRAVGGSGHGGGGGAAAAVGVALAAVSARCGRWGASVRGVVVVRGAG
jgi:hypothetical protein